MAWHRLSTADWDEEIADAADQIEDTALHDVIERFNLVLHFAAAEGVQGAVHDSALNVAGDFRQPALLSAVMGDLTVAGALSTTGIDGWDGNATLVVFGDLHCATLDNDWASLIIVTGKCTVTDWAYAAREDSSFIVGGDFTTPIFVGADIWVSVGGQVRIASGYGYALGLDDAGPAVRPARDWNVLAVQLGLPAGSEEAFLTAMNTRLYRTGSILP